MRRDSRSDCAPLVRVKVRVRARVRARAGVRVRARVRFRARVRVKARVRVRSSRGTDVRTNGMAPWLRA